MKITKNLKGEELREFAQLMAKGRDGHIIAIIEAQKLGKNSDITFSDFLGTPFLSIWDQDNYIVTIAADTIEGFKPEELETLKKW